MIQAEFGAEAYKDCCLACTLGIIVASMAQKLVLLLENLRDISRKFCLIQLELYNRQLPAPAL